MTVQAPPSDPPQPPPPRLAAAMRACQVHIWWPLFRQWTLKARSITLPSAFFEWLQTDGVILPPSVALSSTGRERTQQEDSDDEDKAIQWQREEENVPPSSSSSSFPAFEAALTEAIAELGGAVVPKLNWSVPRDAEWVNGGTLKCETAGDVMLLLKSSDRVQHDLDCLEAMTKRPEITLALSPALPPVLTLRKWASFHPSMHFRCFIYRSILRAVSQREPSAFYPFLADEVPRLRTLLHTFFTHHITPRLASLRALFEEEGGGRVEERAEGEAEEGGEEMDVCMDVYVDRQGRVWVLDLAPWGPPTDALLFGWEEEDGGKKGGGGGVSLVVDGGPERGIEEGGEKERIVFRVVDGEEVCVLPDPWSGCRVPLDMHGCVGPGNSAGMEEGITGVLDLGAIMRATMKERKRRGRGEVESESTDEEGEE